MFKGFTSSHPTPEKQMVDCFKCVAPKVSVYTMKLECLKANAQMGQKVKWRDLSGSGELNCMKAKLAQLKDADFGNNVIKQCAEQCTNVITSRSMAGLPFLVFYRNGVIRENIINFL
jgi:hypothetical protein